MGESHSALDHPLRQIRIRVRVSICLLCGIVAIHGVATLAHPMTSTLTSTETGTDLHLARPIERVAR